jgi:hypothetical protein
MMDMVEEGNMAAARAVVEVRAVAEVRGTADGVRKVDEHDAHLPGKGILIS